VQYDLLRLLASDNNPNLFVVGDEDQSIYRWRGADVGHILRFSEDFPGARVLRIEQNYRSRQKILDAAGAVVAKNNKRLGKQLEATRGEGTNLVFYEAVDAASEANYVADRVSVLPSDDEPTHAAVMYRTNAQSRALEEAFRARGIRYRLLGGFSFYQRAEVKDARGRIVRGDAMVFREAYTGEDFARPLFGILHLNGAHGEFEGRELVGVVVDGEVGGQAETSRFTAKQANAERVEGADPGFAAIDAAGFEKEAHAVAHLRGGLVGEGDGENRVGRHALLNQIGDAIGDDAGLAGSGAGQDKNGALRYENGFTLLRVEIV